MNEWLELIGEYRNGAHTNSALMAISKDDERLKAWLRDYIGQDDIKWEVSGLGYYYANVRNTHYKIKAFDKVAVLE